MQDFWTMSIPEVHDCIRSYGRRAKIKILQQFIQAESIAEHIGRYLNSENKARKPWDFYPELFREEREQFEESKQSIRNSEKGRRCEH